MHERCVREVRLVSGLTIENAERCKPLRTFTLIGSNMRQPGLCKSDTPQVCQPHWPMHAVWCRIGVHNSQWTPRTLTAAQRNRAVSKASGHVALRVAPLPHYMQADTYGHAVYATPLTTPPPVWTPLQAALLEAVQHLRRWDYYSDSALPNAESNQPLDGCTCRWCVLPAESNAERTLLQAIDSAPHAERLRIDRIVNRSAMQAESESLRLDALAAHFNAAGAARHNRSTPLQAL
jgi:hypothetical protein